MEDGEEDEKGMSWKKRRTGRCCRRGRQKTYEEDNTDAVEEDEDLGMWWMKRWKG